eukprot:IDg1398t1
MMKRLVGLLCFNLLIGALNMAYSCCATHFVHGRQRSCADRDAPHGWRVVEFCCVMNMDVLQSAKMNRGQRSAHDCAPVLCAARRNTKARLRLRHAAGWIPVHGVHSNASRSSAPALSPRSVTSATR